MYLEYFIQFICEWCDKVCRWHSTASPICVINYYVILCCYTSDRNVRLLLVQIASRGVS